MAPPSLAVPSSPRTARGTKSRVPAAQIVKDAYKSNLDILMARKQAMEALADRLMEHETVLAEELNEVIAAHPAASSNHKETPECPQLTMTNSM